MREKSWKSDSWKALGRIVEGNVENDNIRMVGNVMTKSHID